LLKTVRPDRGSRLRDSPGDSDLVCTRCGPVGYPKAVIAGIIDASEKSACH
jgi:hypothetical protein